MEAAVEIKGKLTQAIGEGGLVSRWLDNALSRMSTKVLIALLIILIIPIFQPDTLAHLDDKTLIRAWRTWRLLSCIVVLTVFFFVGRRDLFTYLVILFSISVLVSTIMNKGSVNIWVYRWVPIMAAVALVATLCRRRPYELIVSLFVVTLGMSIINLVSVFMFPEGTYETIEGQPGQRFFFGNRNNTYQILIPAIMTGAILDMKSGRKVPWLMLAAYSVAIVQIAIMKSMATLLSLGCLAVLLLLMQSKRARSFLNGFTFLALSVVASVVVVILRLENVFGFFFVDVLHKDLTLSGRTHIWDMVMTLMDQTHNMWGYGLSGYKLFQNPGYTHAHNEFMNVWFVGGIVGLVLFLGIVLLVSALLYRNRKNKAAAVIGATLAALFLIGVVEQLTTPAFFIVCSFAIYVRPLMGIGRQASFLRVCSANEVDYNNLAVHSRTQK